MASVPNILVVDDEPHMVNFLRTLLEVESYEVETACNGLEAVRRVEEGPLPDLVLLDVAMPGLDGLETLGRISEIRPGIKVVMLSCVSDPRTVVKAIHLGAQDYLPKPFQKEDLEAVIKRVLGRSGPGPEKEAPLEMAEEVGDDLYFLAACESMRKLRSQVGMIAGVDVPVLILGESGTGKEILARLIHTLSPRAPQPFVKVNCAAIPNDLLESELFGYEAGAFTGAQRSKPGKFELADGGTLFLDEIGEMHPALQAKLLHVLQDGEFARLGAKRDTAVDVRVLCATNKLLEQRVSEGLFREDLFYRINVVTVHIPPLRERRNEISVFIHHFIEKYSGVYERTVAPFDKETMQALIHYPWPGNIRELENLCKRYVIVGDSTQIVRELSLHAVESSSAATENKGLTSPTIEFPLSREPSLLEIGRQAAWQA